MTSDSACGLMGILNINKPRGITSHDVVAAVRRTSRQRRVGHAGTLDPMAEGVLLVCVGQATRLVEYLADHRKSYRATIRFGAATDTWDAEGQVVERRAPDHLTLALIDEHLPAFRGEIWQQPPLYSAIKREGQPLYKLARRGESIELARRRVQVHALQVFRWESPDLVLDIDCSKGTYVRSIAHELGRAVGVGAHLAALTRTAIGRFTIEQAIDLKTFQDQNEHSRWREHLLPAELAVEHLPWVQVDAELCGRIAQGRTVALALDPQATEGCAFDEQHRLFAILTRDEASGLWQPRKVLCRV